MKRLINWRTTLIFVITAYCLFALFPTFRYFAFVSKERPSNPKQLEAWLKEADVLRKKSIPLGLDIQGGIDLVLKANKDEALKRSVTTRQNQLSRLLDGENVNAEVGILRDDKSIKILVKDVQQRRIAANAIDKNYKAILSGWNPDALINTGECVVSINNSEMNTQLKSAMEGALKVIRERVSLSGLQQASVVLQGQESIRVQIPGERDPNIVKNMVKPGVLKFYLVHQENGSLVQQLFENNGIIKKGEKVAPLKPGAVIPVGYKALPGRAGTNPEPGKERVMYIVREREEMGGENLENAWVFYNQSSLRNPIEVSLLFNKQGAKDFYDVTRKYAAKAGRQGRQLAIALDEVIYSAPVLESEIPDGQARITGDFSQDEAHDLSLVLKAGSLRVDLKPSQSRQVDATLGADSIAASMKALIYCAVIIAIFMVAYYGTAGVIAVFALILNVLILMAIMYLSRATLTLSGIGGILLTMGMAVDANVLIYERMREEIRAGKSMRLALSAGFDRAFSVILDSNLTTLLTALVLLQFGEGSVKGFALTMTFGLIANLYTGLSVTYALCVAWFSLTGKLNLGKLAILTNPKVPFIEMRYYTFAFSGILTVLTIFAFLPRPDKPHFGPSYAVDFTGGVMATVKLDKNYPAGEIDRLLTEKGLAGTATQKFSDSELEALIRVPLVKDDLGQTTTALNAALGNAFGQNSYKILETSMMTAEIGQKFSDLALIVVLGASVAVMLYLWFRFEMTFGAGAVIAVVHDLLLTLGMITLMKIDVSLDVISAFLILLGYSVNDTIVIYDRIREQVTEHTHDKDLKHICNDSMNQTLSRTMITGLTTLFVMTIMFFFGGHSLRPFAITLVLGILFGTYSSVFVAAPIVYEWAMRKRGGRLALTKKTAQQTGRPNRRGSQQRGSEITA